jgi:glycerol-3-phosphate acyltransferase PlsY
MGTPLAWIVWPVLGFLVGSIPFGYLVARARGVDIRTVGSGNIGMTNVWRSLGWKPGATVLALDLLKGVLPTVASEWYWNAYVTPLSGWHGGPAHPVLPLAMATGLLAVLGHTFTPWLGFKGGKGIATGAGVFMALMKVWALVPVGAFLLALAVTRMVSVGSLLGAYSGFITTLAVPGLRWLSPLVFFLAAFVTWTHRENVARIRQGTERRIGEKKPASER